MNAASGTIIKWKPYPKYKDSGVDWLGNVPELWMVKPLKRITSFLSRGNSPEYVENGPIRVINQACIHWNGLNLEKVKYQRAMDVSEWKGYLRKNDLLINSTGTGTLGRAVVFDELGTFIADGHVTIVRPGKDSADALFLLYLMQTPIYQGYIYAALVSGSTNQIELSQDDLRSMPIIIPCLKDQCTIAAFLDRKTAKIDDLIAKKERLIELLQEKRASLISHAVTKGLDPSVPMKDSGVEWLREIPKYWEAKKIKHICSVKGRIGFRGYTSEDLVGESEGALTFGATQIGSNGKIDISNPSYISWDKYYESPEIIIT